MEGIIESEYQDKKKCNLLKLKPDGSVEHYEPSAGGFVLVGTDPAPAAASHEHPTMGDVDFKGNITVAGEHTETLKLAIKGTGTLVFTCGLLTYFEKE